MRTGGQGQAAVLRERADRRRAPLSAWTGTLGRWEKIPRTVTDLWSAIQRLSPPEYAGAGSYPEAFPAGVCRSGEGVWLAMGAFRVHGFLFARMWAVRAWNESNGGK